MLRYGWQSFLVSARGVLTGLLVVSILLRATIPVGFMPAQSSTFSLLPSLRFCTTGLTATTIQLLALQDSSHSHDELITLDCIFASALNKPMLFNTGALFVVWAAPLLWFSILSPWRVLWRKHDYGPPLGSRAPPLIQM